MKKILLSLLSIFLLTAFTSFDKETKLEYKFAVGDEYAWVQTTRQTVKQEIMGMEQVMDNAISGSLKLKVISLTNNGAKLEAQYTTLAMMMKLPAGMQAISFDSEGTQDKTENKVMKAMMNKPFTLTLTKLGVVENIEGEENLWSGFGDLGLDENQLATMKQQFQQNFGKASIKSSFEMALTNYPDKKIKPGDNWKNKTGLGMNFPLETENTWRFISQNQAIVNLSADGVVTTTDKDKIIDLPNGIKSKIDLNGSQNLTSAVNASSGWPNEVKINSVIKGNMILQAGGMIPSDLEVPMEITTESNFKIVKK